MPRHIPEDVTLIMLLYVGMAILVATSSPLSPIYHSAILKMSMKWSLFKSLTNEASGLLFAQGQMFSQPQDVYHGSDGRHSSDFGTLSKRSVGVWSSQYSSFTIHPVTHRDDSNGGGNFFDYKTKLVWRTWRTKVTTEMVPKCGPILIASKTVLRLPDNAGIYRHQLAGRPRGAQEVSLSLVIHLYSIYYFGKVFYPRHLILIINLSTTTTFESFINSLLTSFQDDFSTHLCPLVNCGARVHSRRWREWLIHISVYLADDVGNPITICSILSAENPSMAHSYIVWMNYWPFHLVVIILEYA
jgi:hypothetical protein